jgi:thiol-disulfide isomerase/thioredoxin
VNVALKGFLFGLGIGAAAAAVVFQLWSLHVENQLAIDGEVQILHPLKNPDPAPLVANASYTFPRPWFPDVNHPVDGEWTITPLGGQPVQLSSFRGKAVFLNFWQTSCGPCLAEMPGIEKLSASLRDDPVVFAAVSDEPANKVRAFLSARHLGVPVYLRTGSLPAPLEVIGIPTTYLLNGHGVAVFKSTGEMNWDDDGARNQLRALASQ